MRTLLFSSVHQWPWQRQFPEIHMQGEALAHEGCLFHFCLSPGEAERFSAPDSIPDFWVTWDAPQGAFLNRDVPWRRRILIFTEPPSVLGAGRDYSGLIPDYGIVVSPYDIGEFLSPGAIQVAAPPMLNWFYGVAMPPRREKAVARMMFPELAAMTCPEKTKNCAIVCSSDIAYLPEHFQRITFYAMLKKVFKDKIDYFGRGTRYIDDKKEAIDPYKYTICLENNFIDNFWTEKLADGFLGYSMPIYGGCPNAEAYFPAGSLLRIDYREPDVAIRAVAEALESDAWERALPEITTARNLLLHRYNLPSALARLTGSLLEMERGLTAPEELAARFIGWDSVPR